VATGRVLLVHESVGTRALLTDLLVQEGLNVEAVDSTYACMARFVDEPADLVVMGLADVHEAELEIIPALKKEERAPRVLVLFPSPRRDLAVRALGKGADGYVLEPFYRDEVVGATSEMLTVRADLTETTSPEVAALRRVYATAPVVSGDVVCDLSAERHCATEIETVS